ncbi:MAG: hypothetical protein HY254_10300 [Burkholderiales bacterium]|nr:hypothetical protein [Burkholderiales bacterium]
MQIGTAVDVGIFLSRHSCAGRNPWSLCRVHCDIVRLDHDSSLLVAQPTPLGSSLRWSDLEYVQ